MNVYGGVEGKCAGNKLRNVSFKLFVPLNHSVLEVQGKSIC